MNLLDSELQSQISNGVLPSLLDVNTFVRQDWGTLFSSEDFGEDGYLDELIEKPWGHEYRVYADTLYDVWKLTLGVGHATSTHCHPRKETALLCLSGEGRVRLLDREYTIRAGNLVRFGKGVFHATENIGTVPLELIEVETPRNKLDLVRVKDRYGRSGSRYETDSSAGNLELLDELPHAPGAKLRPRTLDGRFQFAMLDSQELYHSNSNGLVFAVSLAVRAALQQRIDIIVAGAPVPREYQSEGKSLAIFEHGR